MGIGLLALLVFTYAGAISVTFLVLPNPSAFWNFNSLTDDLVKLAAFLYLLVFCAANYRGLLEGLRKISS
jgi:hypothetical protein